MKSDYRIRSWRANFSKRGWDMGVVQVQSGPVRASRVQSGSVRGPALFKKSGIIKSGCVVTRRERRKLFCGLGSGKPRPSWPPVRREAKFNYWLRVLFHQFIDNNCLYDLYSVFTMGWTHPLPWGSSTYPGLAAKAEGPCEAWPWCHLGKLL